MASRIIHMRIIGKSIILLAVLLLALATQVYAVDVTLQWDANTESDLAGYKVYYKTVASGPPYNGIGASEGDSPIDVGDVTEFMLHDLSENATYFFAVTAYDTEDLESGFSNEVDALSINLYEGSNLISLYREPEDMDISAVLNSIDGKYSSVWAFVDGNWKAYDPASPGFSDLGTMESGRGYWIDMNEPGALFMHGSTSPNSVALTSGSNLVGYSSPESLSITEAINSIEGEVVSVWAFVDGNWKVYDPASPGFSDLNVMEPGTGYWIETSEACTWTLP